MDIEGIIWGLLKGEVRADKLDNYTLYFAYVSLCKLKRRLERVYREYNDIELRDYAKSIISKVDKVIKELQPKATNMNICYAVAEAANKIAGRASKEILKKLLLRFISLS